MNPPEDQRPDPEALLHRMQEEESRQGKGKLRLFLGMCAGVGKTYAMLQSAHERLAQGVDVVVGLVETHGRKETEALVEGLAVLPRRQVDYRGVELSEMDLDGILLRHPALVLVDELAHTNIPGSRHPKRWQDVLEILEAGIDVYATLNVQHFESRSDLVSEITGAPVRETVPDHILERAEEVKLVDIPPEELQKRLQEGKVYLGERAGRAQENFFKLPNLTALREISLRLTAERVEHELTSLLEIGSKTAKGAARLLVAVSPSPWSARLIRWTRRVAYNMEARWFAVYVDSGTPLSPKDASRLEANLALAKELGAEVISVQDDDVPGALVRTARRNHVSQIVIGKPRENYWRDLLRGGSPVQHLVREAEDMDLYLVQGDPAPGDKTEAAAKNFRLPPLPETAFAALVVAGVTLGSMGLAPHAGYWSVALVYLVGVLVVATRTGRGPVWLAAILSALCWNFLFIPPKYTFFVARLEDKLMFGLFFVVAMLAGGITAKLRAGQRLLRAQEEHTGALYQFTRDMAEALGADDLLKRVGTRLKESLKADVCFFLATPNGHLSAEPHPASTIFPSEKELSVAVWCHEHRQVAGRGTGALPASEGYYAPLLVHGESLGVAGLFLENREALAYDQKNLMEALSGQLALAIERAKLVSAQEKGRMAEESQRLYKTLLSAISHELRTPLAAIQGAVSGLGEESVRGNPAARQALEEEIEEGAERLHRLVENLLDMTRLESGYLQARLDWCALSDILNGVQERLKGELRGRRIEISIPEDFPLVKVDAVLLEQALVNLVHNACLYTPKETRIFAKAETTDKEWLLVVGDNGPGVPPEILPRLFEKFYRLPGSAPGGAGLGLPITRGLVEAHGGAISASSAPGEGLVYHLRFPRHPMPPPPKEDPA